MGIIQRIRKFVLEVKKEREIDKLRNWADGYSEVKIEIEEERKNGYVFVFAKCSEILGRLPLGNKFELKWTLASTMIVHWISDARKQVGASGVYEWKR